MLSKQEQDEFDRYQDALTTSALYHDSLRGVSFYLSFMLYDFYVAHEHYPTLWAVRLTAAFFCCLGIPLKDVPLRPIIRRILYSIGLSILICSLPILFAVRGFDLIPADIALVSITLVFCMATFRLRVFDASIVGGIYCLCFAWLLHKYGRTREDWVTFVIALGSSYYMGLIGAAVAQNSIYKSFISDRAARLEAQRADSLLEKTFPLKIANELKDKNESAARRLENVSIMFCDIVNFTEISKDLQPEVLVEFLNKIFSSFDRLTAKFGCEKIKTVGDAYMAACGAPIPAPDHAERIVRLALSVKAESKKISLNGIHLRLRIGISSGPVVAGVIGESRFAYDLWGDTVNTASRMENLAPPGGILITKSTKMLIEGIFDLEQIPTLEVKGKGTMDAWLVRSSNLDFKTCEKDRAA